VNVTIQVMLHNSSSFDGKGTIVLYWGGLGANGIDSLNPINYQIELPVQTIPANSSHLFTYSWLPSSQVTSDPDNFNQLVIFAQAVVEAVVGGPEPCVGSWHKSDFNPTATYNAAQVFQFVSVPADMSALAKMVMAVKGMAVEALTHASSMTLAAVESVKSVAAADLVRAKGMAAADVAFPKGAPVSAPASAQAAPCSCGKSGLSSELTGNGLSASDAARGEG
jgi:hypothetical protein